MSEIDLRPVRISVGEVVYPPGGRLGPRWQHDVQLVLLHTGRTRIALDDDPPFMLHPESVALLLPGHRESFEFDRCEETYHSWVQLGIDGQLPEELGRAPRVLPASAALTVLVREAVSARSAHFPTADRLTATLAAAAIWRYVADAEARESAQAGVVELARRHLELHLADPGVGLESVAAAVHVTSAHLVRRFRTELGATPMAYLWRRRVAAGIDLLTNTGLPVGEVARRVGFRSVYHFSRRVKQTTGLAPTELRRRGWSQTADSAEEGGR